jgi:DNA-binding MarR family transcriptional regulator
MTTCPLAKGLTEAEQRAWRAFIEADRLLFERLEHELQHDAGMSHPDYEILVHLSEAPRRELRMSELADQVLFSRSRLSHAVARLERLGWVARRSCPTDKRGTVVRLRSAGAAALEGATRGHVEAVRQYFFEALTPDEVDQLSAITGAIRDRLKATDHPADPRAEPAAIRAAS